MASKWFCDKCGTHTPILDSHSYNCLRNIYWRLCNKCYKEITTIAKEEVDKVLPKIPVVAEHTSGQQTYCDICAGKAGFLTRIEWGVFDRIDVCNRHHKQLSKAIQRRFSPGWFARLFGGGE